LPGWRILQRQDTGVLKSPLLGRFAFFVKILPQRSLIYPIMARVLPNPLDNAHLGANIEEAMNG
jgi:hypothetical protein